MKLLQALIVSLTVGLQLIAVPALAATSANYGSFLGNVGTNAGLATTGGTPNSDLATIIGSIISVVLGLLGVIFLLLTIYAGFLWMTAQGNEEQVQKATGILKNAIIGLIVTLAAYSIATFVVSQVSTATSGTTATTTGA